MYSDVSPYDRSSHPESDLVQYEFRLRSRTSNCEVGKRTPSANG